MNEKYPPDADEEEKEFLDSPLGQAISSGQVVISPEAKAAVAAFMSGDMDHPGIQQLKDELLLTEATDGIPEELAWLWGQVITPPEERA